MDFHALRQSAALSPHPTDKIAAQILYRDGMLDQAQTNARPDLIEAKGIPLGTKLVDRSLYVHAETRALIHAMRPTGGATLLVTDPFCPNCAKQMALAGIKRIVIDGAGFAKLYHVKNELAFRALSLSVAEYCGIAVYVTDDNGATLTRLRPVTQVIQSRSKTEQRAALHTNGGWGRWVRRTIAVRGMAFHSNDFTAKYDPYVDAATHALMRVSALGLKPDTTQPLDLSHWPHNPRPFIDLLGAGIRTFRIKNGPAPEWAGSLSELGIEIIPR